MLFVPGRYFIAMPYALQCLNQCLNVFCTWPVAIVMVNLGYQWSQAAVHGG